MFGAEVVATVTELTAADPACCDRDGLATLAADVRRVRAWLDAVDARIAVHAARLAADGACEPAGDLLAGGGRRASRDAAAAARRGEVCDQLPKVHDALAAGAVSAGHVDAIARTAAGLDDAARSELKELEPAIVGSAKTKPVEAFEREMSELGRILSRDDGVTQLARLKQQRRVRRWVDRQTGMCKTLLELDPETDARVAAAFDAAVAAARARQQGDDVDFEHLRADALVELITGGRSTDRRVPEVSVLIDLETLCHGLHERSVCETGDGNPLPPETIRRLCCDADLLPIVLGGDGVPLDLGRTQRLASHDQRRALRALYRHCAFPGCTVRFDDCRIHHVTWWDKFGPTDLPNLLPLCEAHHHLVHEGGWTLTIDPDRTITLQRPDGTIHDHGDTTNRTPRPAAAATPEVDLKRPSEDEIPIHLERAAAPNRRPPGQPPAPSSYGTDDTPRPWESGIPPHLVRAAKAACAARAGEAVATENAPPRPASADRDSEYAGTAIPRQPPGAPGGPAAEAPAGVAPPPTAPPTRCNDLESGTCDIESPGHLLRAARTSRRNRATTPGHLPSPHLRLERPPPDTPPSDAGHSCVTETAIDRGRGDGNRRRPDLRHRFRHRPQKR